MKRPIKFRGKDTRTGEYRYGFVECFREGLFDKVWMRTPAGEYFEIFPVDPDSVAQLVGYDKDGREVYEGDTVVDADGYERIVEYGDNPDFVAVRTLKEAVK